MSRDGAHEAGDRFGDRRVRPLQVMALPLDPEVLDRTASVNDQATVMQALARRVHDAAG